MKVCQADLSEIRRAPAHTLTVAGCAPAFRLSCAPLLSCYAKHLGLHLWPTRIPCCPPFGHFAAEAVHLACHRCYGQVSSVQMYRNKTVIKCMLHLAGIFPPISYAHVVTPEATGCTPLRLPSNGAFLLHSTLDLEMRSHRPRFS